MEDVVTDDELTFTTVVVIVETFIMPGLAASEAFGSGFTGCGC